MSFVNVRCEFTQLELKKPRSGVFINEQVVGKCTTNRRVTSTEERERRDGVIGEAARLSYDARKLQAQIDEKAKKKFIVKTNAQGEMTACVEPCRPPCTSRARGTQAIFDMRSVIRGNADIRSLRKDADKSHALIISAVALLYSKLDDVQLWTADKVDEVLRLGFCQHTNWTSGPKASPTISSSLPNTSSTSFEFKDFPRSIDVRGFRLAIEVLPSMCKGAMMPPNLSFGCSELFRCIVELFKKKDTSGVLIEVGDIAMALWRKENLYYLFVGYECDETGRCVSGTTTEQKGAACIMMNNRLTDLCDMAVQNATITCKTNASFALHELRVKSVDIAPINEFFVQMGDAELASTATARSALAEQKAQTVQQPPADDAVVDAITPVPLKELSILSLVGGRKRRRPPSAGNKSDSKSQTALPALINPLQAMQSLADAVNTTLETVIEKIEDKIETKCIVPTVVDGKRARRVLVKSDAECLKLAKRKIHRGYEIDPCAEKELVPALTLSQELLLPTNMRIMPDNTAIVHGTQNLMQVVEYNASISVVAPVLAVVMSYKYALSTWDAAIVDFILNTSKYVQECVPLAQYQMFRTPRNHLPDIQVGSKRFSVKVYALCVGPEADIGAMLRVHMFPPSKCDRIVLSSAVYNAAIFWRKNLWYLFDAFPCDPVGIRSQSLQEGVATLQRFISFDAMVQRLRCNQSVARENQMFSVNRVQVKDVTDSAGLARTFKFVERPVFKEQEIIERLAQEQEELVRRNNDRLKQLNKLIQEERCRIKKFNKKAGKEMTHGERDPSLLQAAAPIDRSPIEDSDDEEDEVKPVVPPVVPVVEEKVTEKKKVDAKKGGKKGAPGPPSPPVKAVEEVTVKAPTFEEILRQPFGYVCTAPDHFHKIQGSTCIPHRYRFRCDQIRACHFCGIYATLLSFTREWKNWNFRVVDQCIEEGLSMYQQVLLKGNVERRCLNRILVDNSYYHINVDRFPNRALLVEQQKKLAKENNAVIPPFRNDSTTVFIPLTRTLEVYFQKHRYVLLQFPNCSFAIVKRDCFNLFDPYASHELRDRCRPFRLAQEPPKGVPKVVDEKNTASWICMPTLEALLQYVKQRIRVRDMNTAYELYTIKVIVSYPALNRKHTFAHHMMSFSLRPDELLAVPTFETLALSVPDEQVRWLDAKPTLVPWSRRLSQNLMGQKRYRAQSRWKSFDCELEGELYSLWSNLHPMSALFQPKYRGRQFAGIHAIAACIASLYPIEEWNGHLMNYIVVEGDRYFGAKMQDVTDAEHEVALEELSGTVSLAAFVVQIRMKVLVFGTIYSQQPNEFNLKKALLYFFKEPKRRFGVLHCFRRSLAFGISPRGRYFMYDCMSVGAPLFVSWQGGAYLLLCNTLRRLLHCLVLTLRVPCYNVEFTLHSVRCTAAPKELLADGEEGKRTDDGCCTISCSNLFGRKSTKETTKKGPSQEKNNTYVATKKK